MLRLRHLATLAELSLLLVWLVVFRPVALGGPASYLIVSGVSMLPTLRTGDLVIAQHQAGYVPGDIVAFRVPRGEPGEGAMIIHRVIGEAEGGYVVQGDNKRYPDPWEPATDDILGKMWLSIPGGGRVLGFVRQPILLGAAAGLWGTLFVLSGNKRKLKMPPKLSGAHGRLTLWGRDAWQRGQHQHRRVVLPAEGILSSMEAGTGPMAKIVAHSHAPSFRGLLSLSSQIDGRMRILRPLPPNAAVYLVRKGRSSAWYVVLGGDPSDLK